MQLHVGTGRLWALLIQLMPTIERKIRVFRAALKEVPKSGEVWCEGARILLNPSSTMFDLNKARQFLEFAVQFTPQYKIKTPLFPPCRCWPAH